MSQQDFLAKFQDSMNKLNMVRGNIQNSIQSKEQFTKELKDRLVVINGRLQQLAGLIKELKNKADNLEGQITANTASIGNKDVELQQLKQQMAALTAERENLIANASQQDNVARTQMQQSQAKINQYEEQLRDLKQTAETKSAEVNALRQEMSTTGDAKDAAHVQQLAELTEQSRKQLEQQEAQLKQKEAQLMQRINECEGKMAGFQQEITQGQATLADKQREIDEQILQAQNSGNAVQAQINTLKQENAGLVQRLIDATDAIYQSAEDLKILMESVPNAQTKQEIDVLLQTINQQIEQSFQNISAATQGRQLMPGQQPMMPGQQPMMPGQQPMMPGQQPMMPGQQPMMPGQPIDRNANILIKGNQMSIDTLTKQLAKKGSDVANSIGDQNNKYNIALNKINTDIKTQGDISKIDTILTGITIKKGVLGLGLSVSGGKRRVTRKNRKQKGGFIYKRTRTSRRSKSKSRTTSRRGSG